MHNNPYTGPISHAMVVVDKRGNAIPLSAGQRIQSSPDGNYQQIIGAHGLPTGDRLDRQGHIKQRDPRANQPHAHRAGILTADGNRHLPIY